VSRPRRLGIGLLGAGGWAGSAHLPAYAACPRSEVVAICDTVPERARALAARHGIRRVVDDPQALLDDPAVELVDVCTATDTHAELSRLAVAAGKHVLSEKPLAGSAAEAIALAEAAEGMGVRTKVAFTFRYAPSVRRLIGWVADGTIGEVFHVHGLEQNAQFLDPDVPLRQVPAEAGDGGLRPSSIVEYGSHLVDLVRACGGEVGAVVASMRGFVPERRFRGLDGPRRLPIEDATVALIEFAAGAHGMIQTSHVAIGGAPGVELRVYGSRAAAVARLVPFDGVEEALFFASADDVAFRRVDLGLAGDAGPWPQRYFANLVRHFVDEVLDDGVAECTFRDGATCQRIVDAVTTAHRTRRWIELPT
jgi:predicted dehydrogenase